MLLLQHSVLISQSELSMLLWISIWKSDFYDEQSAPDTENVHVVDGQKKSISNGLRSK